MKKNMHLANSKRITIQFFLLLIVLINYNPSNSILISSPEDQATASHTDDVNDLVKAKTNVNLNSHTDSSSKLEKPSSSLNPKYGAAVWEFCRTCYFTEQVKQIKFSPNMKLLAGGTDNGKIYIWDVTTGNQIHVLKSSSEIIESIIWTKDSSTVISIHKNSILNYWNVTSGLIEKQIDLKYWITGVAKFERSNNGDLLALSSTDGKFSLWDINGTFIRYVSEKTNNVAIDISFSKDDSLLALYLTSGKMLVWNLNNEEIILNQTILLDTLFTPFSYFKGNAIAFSPDNKLLFVALGNNDRVIAYNLITGLPINDFIPYSLYGSSRDHVVIMAVAQFTNENILAFVVKFDPDAGDSEIILYDYAKNTTLLTIQQFPLTAELSHDNSLLASIGSDQKVTIYNVIRGSEIHSLTGHNDVVLRTKFYNSTLFISADYNTVKIWNNYLLLKSIEDSKISFVYELAITKIKNNILVVFSASFEGVIGYLFIYNLTDDSLFHFRSNTGVSTSLDFSPDSSLLASTTSNEIVIWNTSSFSLVNNITFNGVSKGFYFLSNDTLIGSYGANGQITIFQINGTIMQTYQIENQNNGYILSDSLSEDKTLFVMEIIGGKVAVLNLTNSNIKTEKIPIFASYDSVRYGELRFSPDNQYIIGETGFYHTFFIIDTKDLTLKVNLILDIDYYIKFDIEPSRWTLAIGKQDFSVSIIDISPLKDQNLTQFDFDGDGLYDIWENNYSLNNGWYWDRFDDPDHDNLINAEEFNHKTNPLSKDTDNDTITDTYEIKFKLDPNTDDSLLDKDGDGMNNLYEFRMGLDSSKNDSYFDYDNDGLINLEEFYHQTDVHNPDTDFDGMPDKWEVDNKLNPIDRSDALLDNDLDGISNIDEYKAGTDPNNFFIVPLLSINNFYLGLMAVGSMLIVFGYLQYRRWLTSQYLAPNYSTAKKVKKSGLEEWYEYTRKEKELDREREKAKSFLLEGLVDNSITLYYSLVDSLKLLSKEVETAETLVRILFISQKLEKTLPIDYRLIHEKFPLRSRNEIIKKYNDIIEAFEYESKNNPGIALIKLNDVYTSNILPTEISLITFYSILDIMIEETQINKSIEFFNTIQRKIKIFISQAEKQQMYEYVCGANLLLARLYFYKYKLDKGTEYIDKVTEIAQNKKVYYYIQKASTEVEAFNKIKDNIKKSLAITDNTTLTIEKNFEEYKRQLLDYAVQAKKIIDDEQD